MEERHSFTFRLFTTVQNLAPYDLQYPRHTTLHYEAHTSRIQPSLYGRYTVLINAHIICIGNMAVRQGTFVTPT